MTVFSSQTRGQEKVARCLSSAKGKSRQPRILYLVKIPFRNEWNETFSDKEKLRESAASRSSQKE